MRKLKSRKALDYVLALSNVQSDFIESPQQYYVEVAFAKEINWVMDLSKVFQATLFPLLDECEKEYNSAGKVLTHEIVSYFKRASGPILPGLQTPYLDMLRTYVRSGSSEVQESLNNDIVWTATKTPKDELALTNDLVFKSLEDHPFMYKLGYNPATTEVNDLFYRTFAYASENLEYVHHVTDEPERQKNGELGTNYFENWEKNITPFFQLHTAFITQKSLEEASVHSEVAL